MTRIRVSTLDELREALAAHPSVSIVGADSRRDFRVPGTAAVEVEIGLTGVVEFSSDDQVVVVRAGTPLAELQKVLMAKGQCLPLVPHRPEGGFDEVEGTVGGAVATNLPELLEDVAGSWRDWLLGATILQADGTLAKGGSRAVKNVAGYDVHKFMVGSRGTLGVLTEVILRTTPVRALPKPSVEWLNGPAEGGWWIQRTLTADFEAATKASRDTSGYDLRPASTLWRRLGPEETLTRFEGDWVLRSGAGTQNLVLDDPVQVRLMRRAKALFDPGSKLNPGEMGIF